MSIAKGFLIISLFLSGFLFFLCKYFYLKHKLTKEREYFINTLNHDIRVSLLAQLRAYEIIEKSNYSYEILSELLKEVNHSCKYSYEMVNMLLHTYQFENGENVLNYETFNLSNLIYSIISKSMSLIKDKKLKLNYNLNDEIMAYADKQALHKALGILINIIISNAKQKSTINFCLTKVKNKYLFYIKYIGNFLTEEEKSRMFSKKAYFSTVGHGIKMNLCKKIIDFHHGNISINSENGINLFKIELPAKVNNIVVKNISESRICYKTSV